MAKNSTIKLIGDVEKWCLGAAFSIIFLVKMVDGDQKAGTRRPPRTAPEGISLGTLEPKSGHSKGQLEPLPDPTKPIYPIFQRKTEALSEALLESGFALPPSLEKRFGLTTEQKIYLQKALNRMVKRLGPSLEKTPNLESLVRDLLIAFDETERIFMDLRPQKGQKIDGQDLVAEVLKDPKRAEKVFEKIELNFSIPREDARAFARGHDYATLADWADFVEKRMK